jgi:hypothetical protein
MANIPPADAGLPPVVPPGGPIGPPAGLPPWQQAPGLVAQTLQDRTQGQTAGDVIREVNRIVDLFNDPNTTPATLHHRAVIALEPTCFLTIMNTTPPLVRLIYTMGQFQTAFGLHTGLHGKTFAFSGEQEGTQLPLVLMEPDTGPMHLFTVSPTVVPSSVEIEAYYVNGQIPIVPLMPPPPND